MSGQASNAHQAYVSKWICAGRFPEVSMDLEGGESASTRDEYMCRPVGEVTETRQTNFCYSNFVFAS